MHFSSAGVEARARQAFPPRQIPGQASEARMSSRDCQRRPSEISAFAPLSRRIWQLGVGTFHGESGRKPHRLAKPQKWPAATKPMAPGKSLRDRHDEHLTQLSCSPGRRRVWPGCHSRDVDRHTPTLRDQGLATRCFAEGGVRGIAIQSTSASNRAIAWIDSKWSAIISSSVTWNANSCSRNSTTSNVPSESIIPLSSNESWRPTSSCRASGNFRVNQS